MFKRLFGLLYVGVYTKAVFFLRWFTVSWYHEIITIGSDEWSFPTTIRIRFGLKNLETYLFQNNQPLEHWVDLASCHRSYTCSLFGECYTEKAAPGIQGGVSRPREVFQEVGNHMIFGVIKAVTLGGGNSNIFYFPLYTWGNDPIWRVFFKWVGSTTNSCWTLGVDGGSHSDGTRSFTIQCPEGWCWLSKRPSSFIQTRPLIHSFG